MTHFIDAVSDTGKSVEPRWRLPIEGSRVRLRQLRMSDTRTFSAYRSDPAVARYQGWRSMDEEQAGAFIGEMQAVQGPRRGAWIQLGIAITETDFLIGDIGLYMDLDGTAAQIGFSCATGFQRQGLASEAVRLLLDQLRTSFACLRVRAVVDSRNTPSSRLLTRVGFSPVDVLPATHRDEECIEITYELSIHGLTR